MPALDKRVFVYFDEKLKQEVSRERAEREYEEAREKYTAAFFGEWRKPHYEVWEVIESGP